MTDPSTKPDVATKKKSQVPPDSSATTADDDGDKTVCPCCGGQADPRDIDPNVLTPLGKRLLEKGSRDRGDDRSVADIIADKRDRAGTAQAQAQTNAKKSVVRGGGAR